MFFFFFHNALKTRILQEIFLQFSIFKFSFSRCENRNYFGVKEEPSRILSDVLIVHVGTNNLLENIILLNNLRKIHQICLELSPETKLVFSNIIIRKDKYNLDNIIITKDKYNLDKHRKDVNAQMKNFCQ